MRVFISPECKAEIMFHVHKSKVEISGLGRIEKTSTGEMVVTKVYMLKQENAATTTDIDPEAIAQLMYTSREDKGDLNFWWHSHVNMGAFWSGTDMDTIREFGKQGYIVATVFNKLGEHKTAYMQGGNDFLPEVFVDDIPTSFEYLPTGNQVEAWGKEQDDCCSMKTYAMANYGTTGNVGARGFGKTWDKDEDAHWANNYAGKDEIDDSPLSREKDSFVPVRGTYTGFTRTMLVGEILKVRTDEVENIRAMETTTSFLWHDLFEQYYGYEAPDDDEVEQFVTDCQSMDFFVEVVEEVDPERIKLELAPPKAKVHQITKTKRRSRGKGKHNKALKAGSK